MSNKSEQVFCEHNDLEQWCGWCESKALNKKLAALEAKAEGLERELGSACEVLKCIAQGTGVGDDGVHEVPASLLRNWAKVALDKLGEGK